MAGTLSKPKFTILIPTYDHGDAIRTAVGSVLEQTLQDYEIFVVGDGATPDTRAAVEDLARTVPQIRFFDLQKEAGRCAANRHVALAEARSEFVCYLDDDDFWLPEHLATMADLLSGADLAHTAQIMVEPDCTVVSLLADLSDPRVRERMLREAFNFFGPTVAGHTLAAYRRLPVGWAPAPPEVWNDLHMWRKFLSDGSLRTASLRRITAIHLPGSLRIGWRPAQRIGELRFWRSALRDTRVRARLDYALTQHPSIPADFGGRRHDTRATLEEILGLVGPAPPARHMLLARLKALARGVANFTP